jgi:hypothetical protein
MSSEHSGPGSRRASKADLMFWWQNAWAVPLRTFSHCASFVVLKKLRRRRWLVACSQAEGNLGAGGG